MDGSMKIVRLPTAARRKVRQHSVRDVVAYMRANPWPGEYKAPFRRADEAERARPSPFAHIEMTPALIVAVAMFGMADEQQRRGALAVAELIAVVRGDDAGRDAVLMMNSAVGFVEAARDLAKEVQA